MTYTQANLKIEQLNNALATQLSQCQLKFPMTTRFVISPLIVGHYRKQKRFPLHKYILIQHFTQPLYFIQQDITLFHNLLILRTLHRGSRRLNNPINLIYRTM